MGAFRRHASPPSLLPARRDPRVRPLRPGSPGLEGHLHRRWPDRRPHGPPLRALRPRRPGADAVPPGRSVHREVGRRPAVADARHLQTRGRDFRPVQAQPQRPAAARRRRHQDRAAQQGPESSHRGDHRRGEGRHVRAPELGVERFPSRARPPDPTHARRRQGPRPRRPTP